MEMPDDISSGLDWKEYFIYHHGKQKKYSIKNI